MRRALPLILLTQALAVGGCSWIIGQPITDDGGAGDLGGGGDGGGVRPDAAPMSGCQLGGPVPQPALGALLSWAGELVDVAAMPGGAAVAAWIGDARELRLMRTSDMLPVLVHGSPDVCAGPRLLEEGSASLAVAAVCWNGAAGGALEAAHLYDVDGGNNVTDQASVGCGINTPHVAALARATSRYVFGCGAGFRWTRDDMVVEGGDWVASPASELRMHQGPNGAVYAYAADVTTGGDLVWGTFDPAKSGASGQPAGFNVGGSVLGGVAVGNGASVFLAALVKTSPLRLRARLGGDPAYRDVQLATARTDAGRPIGIAVLPDRFVVAVATNDPMQNVTFLQFAKTGDLAAIQTGFAGITAGAHPQLAYSPTGANTGNLWVAFPDLSGGATRPALVEVPVTCTP